MNRLCRILCLACAVLLLLPSCQTRSLKNQDSLKADAALGSDPSDTRSQDEILEELFAQTDGPVVVGWVPTTPILYKETAYPQLINQPHVFGCAFCFSRALARYFRGRLALHDRSVLSRSRSGSDFGRPLV